MPAMRYFNTEGACDPDIHYMVNLDDKLDKIKNRFVDRGKYFIMNRGRQYGKTTTLKALKRYLKTDYLVLSFDFQMLGSEDFKDEPSFSRAFAEIFIKEFQKAGPDYAENIIKPVMHFAEQTNNPTLRKLFEQLSEFCAKVLKPVVVIIDEADSASNNRVFLDFLSLLRGYYLDRENTPIFHSVILAGVYDIRDLKLKLRPEEEHQYNSPWNIAAKFNIDMSFSSSQIAAMLQEYVMDTNSDMNIPAIAEYIYQYTSGYPYFVSAICKILDEELPEKKHFADRQSVWNREGITEAVSILLKENIPLFDNMAKQLDSYQSLLEIIKEILYEGKQILYSPMEKSVHLGVMFGFLKEENGHVAIASRIFEMALLNLFIAKEAVESKSYLYGQRNKNQFVQNGRLDMDLVLEKFAEHFADVYNDNDEKFVEKYGRKIFLLYLKPIINGTGNYYIEAQTRDAGRTDVVMDYLGQQFVIELKIWHGIEYQTRGEKQLAEYLDYFHLKKGYLLSFNFNKKKVPGIKTIKIADKIIKEAVI